MAGLPKKYAKMGFKRGWAAYRRAHRSKTRRTRRSVPVMARRRSYRRKAKTVYRRSRSAGGSFKPIIDGFIVGAASGFLRDKIPYADAITQLGVGYFRNNTTLKTLGAMTLGTSLLGGINPSVGNNSGGYL